MRDGFIFNAKKGVSCSVGETRHLSTVAEEVFLTLRGHFPMISDGGWPDAATQDAILFSFCLDAFLVC
jgi:hypothetical protein